MDDIHGLRVWDSARALAKRCVEIARRNRLPDPSGLMEQLCRAASSVSANIAESMGAGTAKQRLQSLRVAHRSGWETRHHIIEAFDTGFVTPVQHRWLSNRAAVNVKMIFSLIVKVERSEASRDPESRRRRRPRDANARRRRKPRP